MTTVAAGLGLGLSLIIAIGAQNVFVLRQGIRREHVGVVVAICAVSDAVLIALGIVGLGAIIGAAPWVIDAVRWAGAAFLLAYGALAAKRAWRPSATLDASGAPAASGASVAAVAGTALALTWLNPHVYLDTVFLLGSVASTHAQPWLFGAGAMAASLVWFAALGYGAHRLAPLLNTQRAWRILDALIAVIMVALAVSLVLTR